MPKMKYNPFNSEWEMTGNDWKLRRNPQRACGAMRRRTR